MNKFKVALIANDDHQIPDRVYKRLDEEGIEFIYMDCHSRKDLEKKNKKS